jgi:hypothetical protein
MAGKAFTEPIRVLSYAATRIAGGGHAKGAETVKYSTIATITPRTQSRYQQDSSSSLSTVYDIEFYRNPSQLIDANDIIEWRGGKMKIQDVLETDNYRKYKIKTVKQ